MGPSAGASTDLGWLSRSIAVSMAQSGVRSAVRDAMRSSRLTEHKLSLQGFLASVEGSSLLRGAAAVQGVSPQEFSGLIARLPELDFYVPRREQRLSWRGNRD